MSCQSSFRYELTKIRSKYNVNITPYVITGHSLQNIRLLNRQTVIYLS